MYFAFTDISKYVTAQLLHSECFAIWVQWPSSKSFCRIQHGTSSSLRTEKDIVPETLCSLEYRTMDKVKKIQYSRVLYTIVHNTLDSTWQIYLNHMNAVILIILHEPC
jgi:hypothetical protein